MNKLEAYLKTHIRWLHEMVSGVGPGEDLPALLSFADKDYRMKFMPMPAGSNLSQWARDRLEDAEAIIYATVTAGWIVPLEELETDMAERLEPLVVEHGTDHPEVRPYRKECVIVTAGDCDGTLLSVFLVERDPEGQIAGLVERKEPSNCWSGPMADLLVTRH